MVLIVARHSRSRPLEVYHGKVGRGLSVEDVRQVTLHRRKKLSERVDCPGRIAWDGVRQSMLNSWIRLERVSLVFCNAKHIR